MTYDVIPRFLFARIILCVLLFDTKGFGDILEIPVPAWLDWTCFVVGIPFSAYLCLQLVVGARILEKRKKEESSE